MVRICFMTERFCLGVSFVYDRAIGVNVILLRPIGLRRCYYFTTERFASVLFFLRPSDLRRC